MDFVEIFCKSQLPIAFAGHYGMYETSGAWNISFRLSGIKDGVSTSEKREFLISVGGRDTVRRIYSILPDFIWNYCAFI